MMGQIKNGVRYWTVLELIRDIMLSGASDPEEDNIIEDRKDMVDVW